ncbi:hypothetical protein Ahy_A03g010489 isoform D [Arachis hypogaea]|uniref:ALOG domain-containing protein n=1 Tax=Arachis hypogaea TaxID=3818 RepID=A0A445DMF8_ARAHY|nr:hypothetical protein Ahy_A03g010489 isoform D [Arachis hypogaea]
MSAAVAAAAASAAISGYHSSSGADTRNHHPFTQPEHGQQVSVPLSRYESQKRRDWNTFGQYLKNHRPPLTLSRCSGAHVLEFLRYLDQFGKTKVHSDTGNPEMNPFGARAVRLYLREVRDVQAKARGIAYEKKKRRKNSNHSQNQNQNQNGSMMMMMEDNNNNTNNNHGHYVHDDVSSSGVHHSSGYNINGGGGVFHHLSSSDGTAPPLSYFLS